MKKGFTLVELLIVIAIIAILATIVVVIINPAEMLRQARDSTRISDMSTINSAIALFFAGASDISHSAVCRVTSATTAGQIPDGCVSASVVTSTAVDGNGWVAIALTRIPGGSPISTLPIDPSNGSSQCYDGGTTRTDLCQYAFMGLTANSGEYRLATRLESTRYGHSTEGSFLPGNDGGADAGWYEVGSKMD